MKQISDMALYTPLYETDGNTFASRDAHGYLCTATGALWTPQGRFFGGSGRIELPDLFSSSAITELSVVAWVKPETALDFRTIISNINAWYGTPEYGFHLAFGSSPSRLITAFGKGAGGMDETSTQYDFTLGKFYCVGFSFKKDAHLFRFINGQTYYRTVPAYAIDCSESGLVYLGANAHNIYYNPYIGTIGEMAAFNRALTPTEIDCLYLKTKRRYQ